MLFLLSHTHQRVDATLRHYLVRGTRTGERSRQFDRLVSTSTVTTEPPRGPASPEDVEFGTSIDAEARRVERLDAEFPGAAARLTASRVLADFPRRSAPDKALAADPKAALGAAGGAEEFTVIVKTSRAAADGDAFGSRALRRVCELKRAIERSPGYGRRVHAVKGENRDKEPNPYPRVRLERKRSGRVRPHVLGLRRRLSVRTRRSSRRPTRVRPDRSRRLDVKRWDRFGSTGVLVEGNSRPASSGLRPSLGCDPRAMRRQTQRHRPRVRRRKRSGRGVRLDSVRGADGGGVKTVAWADFRQSTSSQDEGCEKGSFDPASAASARSSSARSPRGGANGAGVRWRWRRSRRRGSPRGSTLRGGWRGRGRREGEGEDRGDSAGVSTGSERYAGVRRRDLDGRRRWPDRSWNRGVTVR